MAELELIWTGAAPGRPSWIFVRLRGETRNRMRCLPRSLTEQALCRQSARPEGGAATMILWLDLCGIHRAEDLWAEAPALIDRHLIEASLPA